MTPRITAVLFDLGDTLTHPPTEPLEIGLRQAQERVDALLRSWGLQPIASLARDAIQAAQAAELNAYRTDCTLPPFWSVARDVAAAKGLALSQEQASQLWEACRLDERLLGGGPVPGAVDTLAWLKARGFRLGCVTNTLFGAPGLIEALEADGLAQYLDAVAISCDLGYLKPHPNIFRHALDALGVAPAAALMVGDSLRADVGGAKAMGMTAVWKCRHDAYPQMERALFRAGLSPAFDPDYVIDDLWQVTELPVLNND